MSPLARLTKERLDRRIGDRFHPAWERTLGLPFKRPLGIRRERCRRPPVRPRPPTEGFRMEMLLCSRLRLLDVLFVLLNSSQRQACMLPRFRLGEQKRLPSLPYWSLPALIRSTLVQSFSNRILAISKPSIRRERAKLGRCHVKRLWNSPKSITVCQTIRWAL